MAELLDNPAFRSYAVCAVILVFKMLASAQYTGLSRRRVKVYLNPEDARAFGGSAPVANEEHPLVARALRVQRNDLENIPAFLALGLICVLAGATPRGAAIYFWTFTITRLIHTPVYILGLQPWRAIMYIIGALALVGMGVQILIAAL